jgi:hypothetical protein
MDATPEHEAARKLVAVKPHWTGLKIAREAVDLDRNTMLHAGPAFSDPHAIPLPVVNSACVAAVYEGLASAFGEAEIMIRENHIRLEPAQDRNVVTPLAAVVSSSTVLQIVTDQAGSDATAFAPLNGGSGPAPRLGLRTTEALSHFRWMNGFLAEALSAALESGSISLIPIARNGLSNGDDCHGRTVAATRVLRKNITPRVRDKHSAVLTFLDAGPSFFLNLWMAACKCSLSAVRTSSSSTIVTAAGGNGLQFGIQVGESQEWFTCAATPPNGRLDADMPSSRALGAIGDSAIVDVSGFGAMAMDFASAQEAALATFMPVPAAQLRDRVLVLEHPGFSPLCVRTGLSARLAMTCDVPIAISLGILDRQGVRGRIGGGIYVPPLELFQTAVKAARQRPSSIT